MTGVALLPLAALAALLLASAWALAQRSPGPFVFVALGLSELTALWAMTSPAPLLGTFTLNGHVLFALDAWSGVWLFVTQGLLLVVAFVLKDDGASPGAWLSLGWTALAVTAFFAAKTPLTMVLSWGLLTIGAYAIVAVGADRAAARRASWAMMVVTELGASALLLGALLISAGGRTPGLLAAAAGLGVVGLGSKAGLFPFQLWLPLAEPEASGAGAGVLSGVLSTVAMVGLWQWLSWTDPTPLVAWALVILGLGGSLLGAIHAVIESDYKRVLAYSTVEWCGLAFAMLGLTLLFRFNRLPVAAGLTEGAYFTLLLMHLGAKLAAFTATGWIERATGTRLLDDVGGLFRQGGALSKVLLLSIVALMAMPPTGGYLAEWMGVESVMMGGASGMHLALMWLAVPLALIAAVGATAMLRFYGHLFLGPGRGGDISRPHRSELAVIAVGALLAWGSGLGAGWLLPRFRLGAPQLLGIQVPSVVAPTFASPGASPLLNSLGGRIFDFLPKTSGAILFPAGGFAATSPWYLFWFGGAVVVLVFLGRKLWVRRHFSVPRKVEPWTGGGRYDVAAHWSASGMAHPLRLAFAPLVDLRRSRTEVEHAVHVETRTEDRLVAGVFWPVVKAAVWVTKTVQRYQTGKLSHYLTYMVVAVLVGLLVLRLTGQV